MIEIKNLYKSFGDNDVITDVSFEIEKGDVFGIIGQSGAGKSTLLRCINGLEPYNSGSITIDGKEVSSLSKEELRRQQKDMGMIFQNFNLMNRLNVYDNVALPLKFWGQNPKDPQNDKRIKELLELVGLSDKAKARPRELSGGQKQRVAIARALVMNPSILLCDEATSALDPKITQGILALLMKIHEEMGITIIVVTHQMEVVKQICNKTVFLKNGKIVAKGKPEELFVSSNEDVRDFVGDNSDILPETGANIQLFFTKDNAKGHTITSLAHDLNIDFDICQGKLENFRGSIMGSLIINVEEKDKKAVLKYLDDIGVEWEEVVNNA
ncbi:MAG: methionine ABC transporter ATP-binding protein [Erysipelotrichaceae bacterium]|nr:methionine ABC transporter ATP-binding protein [Erysipelotrichaceae bacterium]